MENAGIPRRDLGDAAVARLPRPRLPAGGQRHCRSNFAGALQEAGAASQHEFDIKCLPSAISIDSHWWKIIAMQMLIHEAGVKLLFHTQVVETIREGDRICGVIVENKSGRQRIEADVTIDCSGDGDVAARGGVKWEKGRTGDGLVQAPTLVFKLGGVDRSGIHRRLQEPPPTATGNGSSPIPQLWEKMMRRIDRMQVIICGG